MKLHEELGCDPYLLSRFIESGVPLTQELADKDGERESCLTPRAVGIYFEWKPMFYSSPGRSVSYCCLGGAMGTPHTDGCYWRGTP